MQDGKQLVSISFKHMQEDETVESARVDPYQRISRSVNVGRHNRSRCSISFLPFGVVLDDMQSPGRPLQRNVAAARVHLAIVSNQPSSLSQRRLSIPLISPSLQPPRSHVVQMSPSLLHLAQAFGAHRKRVRG